MEAVAYGPIMLGFPSVTFNTLGQYIEKTIRECSVEQGENFVVDLESAIMAGYKPDSFSNVIELPKIMWYRLIKLGNGLLREM